MRIIAGKFKNKKIEYIKNNNTRPLKDNVKENIFNILNHSKLVNIELKNSKVLDLYAGIGSFGIECISRGSTKVVFVENNGNTLKVLEKNLKKIDAENKSIIVSNDIFDYLNFTNSKDKFDLIFLDPPFKDNKFIEIIKMLKKNNHINKNHLIIIHREKKSEDYIKQFFKVIEQRIYGRSQIFFGNIL